MMRVALFLLIVCFFVPCFGQLSSTGPIGELSSTGGGTGGNVPPPIIGSSAATGVTGGGGFTGSTGESGPPACLNVWREWGPTVTYSENDFQTENIPNVTISGAVSKIVTNPINGDIAYVSAVNGGVWKTLSLHSDGLVTNQTFSGPAWRPLTDYLPCTSISALTISREDPNVLAAGCGTSSSLTRHWQDWAGVWVTVDGGETWKKTNFPPGYSISSLLILNETLIVASSEVWSDLLALEIGGGLWVSADFGNNFTTPVPTDEAIYQLAYDAITHTIYAVGSKFPNISSVFTSGDGGLTWNDWTVAIETNRKCDASVAYVRNAVVSVHRNYGSIVYAAYFYDFPICYDFFVSYDLGKTWISLGQPLTNEVLPNVTNPFDLLFMTTLGPAGALYFDLLADPTFNDTIYVGGTLNYPGNSLGANAYTGRLFRGKLTNNGQNITWETLTHNGTHNHSAPFHSSLSLAWDDTAEALLYTCVGGVYVRTSPRDNTGDWFVLNGNLSIAEVHDVAYDHRNNLTVIAVEDHGIEFQRTRNQSVFESEVIGDGFSVVIDADFGNPPIFYGTTNNGFLHIAQVNTWELYGALPGGHTFSWSPPSLFANWFANIVPIELNIINPFELLVCGQGNGNVPAGCVIVTVNPTDLNSPPEFSLNVSVPFFPTRFKFGGWHNGQADSKLIIAIDSGLIWRTNATFQDSIAHPAPWGLLRAVGQSFAINQFNYYDIFVVDLFSQLWYSKDFGQSFINVTGDIFSVTGNLFGPHVASVAVIPVSSTVNALLIGTSVGVYVAFDDQFQIIPNNSTGNNTQIATNVLVHWQPIGDLLPHTLIFSIKWDSAADRLLIGSFGRGIWTLDNVCTTLNALHLNQCFTSFTTPFSSCNALTQTLVNPPLYPCAIQNGTCTDCATHIGCEWCTERSACVWSLAPFSDQLCANQTFIYGTGASQCPL